MRSRRIRQLQLGQLCEYEPVPPFLPQRPQTLASNRVWFIKSGGFIEGKVRSTTSLTLSESISQTDGQGKELSNSHSSNRNEGNIDKRVYMLYVCVDVGI
jgi:hypothetical protein